MSELLGQLSSVELSEWQALAMLERRGAAAVGDPPEKVEKDLRRIFGRPCA